MKIVFYSANCTGDAGNCIYSNKIVAENEEQLAVGVAKDHVAARFSNSYRSIENFVSASSLDMDIDNDHSEDPSRWLTPEKLASDPDLGDTQFACTPSRNNMRQKGTRSPRPRFHVQFVIEETASAKKIAALKQAIFRKYPFFDGNALDAARFMFGAPVSKKDVFWNDGFLTVDEVFTNLSENENHNGNDWNDDDDSAEPLQEYGSILEGSRNNTMSHFAGRVLKKYGICEKAHNLFLERAERCKPPLSGQELNSIWKSAVKFAKKITESEGYIPPEDYNDEFGTGRLKPEDYSDMGEARVLAAEFKEKLKFTNATDYLAFEGDRWYEDKPKALGMVMEFMDLQLSDAMEAVAAAEDALIAIGIPEKIVKGHGKDLEKYVPVEKLGLLYALIGALTYQKFVMKYRNCKNIVNTMAIAKPMLAIDVSEFDYDAEYLNTPAGTFDLEKGMDGMHTHDPDDLITKITACSPGDKGTDLWIDALNTFFCNDSDLIDYVQKIVGMAAVGRVYAEQMIIAYGGGANGKSTFWNTVSRVLGNYSGKISAEALTMNCKRNVKPEMAELKGKRLIIASELEEGTRLNTGMVKQLCSVDPIEAEKKYKDPFSFDPSHTLVLYTNHLPKVSANDDGTWRRLIVIPFNAKITGRSDIKNYSDFLFENAGPAIMKWIVEGAAQAIAMEYRIPEPQVVKEAIAKYRDDNDWLGQFLAEHCDIGQDLMEKSGELYQAYRTVCLRNGEYIRSTTDFYGSLEKAGFIRHRKNTGTMVSGLKLKEAQDFLE